MKSNLRYCLFGDISLVYSLSTQIANSPSPNLEHRINLFHVYHPDIPREPKDGNQISFANGNRNPQVYFPRPPDPATASGDSVDRNAIAPSDPAILISQRSVLAVGFLTFLILLNSLQVSEINLKA